MLMKCVFTTIPGIDALLFVLKLGEKFTDELQKTQELFSERFGDGIRDYTHLLITNCDDEKDAIEYVRGVNTHPSLRELASQCGDRILFINNKGSSEILNRQVESILQHLMDEKIIRPSYESDLHKEIKKHIWKTRFPDKVSPESLKMYTERVPDIPEEPESARPGSDVKTATGNLKMIDVSASGSGFYHTTPPPSPSRSRPENCRVNQGKRTKYNAPKTTPYSSLDPIEENTGLSREDESGVDVKATNIGGCLDTEAKPARPENKPERTFSHTHSDIEGQGVSDLGNSDANTNNVAVDNKSRKLKADGDQTGSTVQDSSQSIEMGGHEEVDENTKSFRHQADNDPSFIKRFLNKYKHLAWVKNLMEKLSKIWSWIRGSKSEPYTEMQSY